MARQAPTPAHNKAFGAVMAELRRQAGFSQELLGFEAGLDRSYISLLERGLRSPTLDTLFVLSPVFGLTVSQLLSLTESKLEELDVSPN